MRGIASTLEKHHRVQILDEALEAAVRLSRRYIPARQLPDKSVSLLDTACARVAISQHAVPAEVDDSRRRISALDTELEIIGREKAVGVETSQREAQANEKLTAEHERLKGLEARWQEEKGLVDRVLEMRAKLRGSSGTVEGTSSTLEKAAAVAKAGEPEPAAATPPLTGLDRERMLSKLREAQAQLTELQGETPLILPSVDAQAVASVVQDWTGIPVGRMVKNEIETVLKLADALGQRVIGQSHGLEMVVKRIQTSRAGLDNPNKPIGVFMLCGPSGVGKTETALALAESLYGGEQNVITINMSEFQEAHTVSTLKGAPPGYVGYGEGGILTEAVRRRPYSVVLLDELEKANPDVFNILLQVLEDGRLTDGQGRTVDFTNTVLIMTSNLPGDPQDFFKPEFFNRIDEVVRFRRLSEDDIRRIVDIQVGRLAARVAERRLTLVVTDAARDWLARAGYDPDLGARPLRRVLQHSVEDPLALALLEGRYAEGDTVTVEAPGDEGIKLH